MKNMDYCYLLLPSVHDAMKAEKLLLQSGCAIQIIATPREISHNCGVVIKFSCAEINTVLLSCKELSAEQKIFKKNSNNMYYEITPE